jgi:glycosyltransferase domain-containing protein
MYSNFDNLISIVIPTKNRKDILLNKLKLYKKLDFNSKIIIIDSSDFSLEADIKSIKLNINYIHNKSFSANQAIKFGYEIVETKYVCFEGDDDLFIPKTLYYFINFLEKNHNYVAIHGKGIRVFEPIHIIDEINIGNKIPSPNKYISNQDLDTRINSAKTNFFASQYSITRASIIKTFLNLYDLSNSRTIEYLHLYFLLLNGPIMCSSKFFRIQYMYNLSYENTWQHINQNDGFINDVNKLIVFFPNLNENLISNYIFFIRSNKIFSTKFNFFLKKLLIPYKILIEIIYFSKAEKLLNNLKIKKTNKYNIYKQILIKLYGILIIIRRKVNV